MVLLALVVVTLLVLAASIRYGAIDFSIAEISRALASLLPGRPEPTLNQRIFLELRCKLHLLIGPNGAGKSTLIKVLARLLRPQNGKVEYDGADVQHASEAILAKQRAVLSQAVEVAFPLSVREVVMMGRYPHFGGHPGPNDEKIVDEVMAHFDVTEFSERNYQTLSGGERQRVNFARVLAQLWRDDNSTGRYLFLDEPLTFLDIRHQIDFMKKVRACVV
jgi:iron complex transport system ATP-binding protein